MKNKQTEMNNTITEVKNTLEVTDSRITEVEEQINDLEDRMVEITAEEQNKRKRMKRIEDSLRDLWANIKCTNVCVIAVPEEEDRKALRKFLKKLQLKTSPTWERKQSIKSKKQSPLQDKPKEKHFEKHINQTNRD